jgi:hypothetical protein
MYLVLLNLNSVLNEHSHHTNYLSQTRVRSVGVLERSLKVSEVYRFELGKIVEYFSKDEIGEFLIFVLLGHDYFIVEISDINDVTHHVLQE